MATRFQGTSGAGCAAKASRREGRAAQGFPRSRFRRPANFAAIVLVAPAIAWFAISPSHVMGQPPTQEAPAQVAPGDAELPDQRAEEALRPNPADGPEEPAAPPLEPAGEEASINLLELVVKGGWLVLPIAVMSIVVLALGVERSLALRRRRIIPRALAEPLDEIARKPDGFDARRIQQLCHQYPSTLADILQAMIWKLGRPLVEVERAITDASEREAARLYANVRTLNLAAAICPLLGLFGTVWGMIQAFFATANLPVGANKAEALAEGIYVALVTTFTGLAVAIPAAVMAHMFEGRIQTLLLEIDDLLLRVLPHWERFEGRGLRTRLESPPPRTTGATAPEEHQRPATSAPK